MRKILLLVSLAKRGALGQKTSVTVRELAGELGTSPQTVLRLLREMEKEGLLERESIGRKTLVEVTAEGARFLEELCEEITEAISSGVIIGEIVSGLGEGAYYVKLYAPLIREYLGFDPYLGTLNVRVLFPKTVFDALCNVRPVILPGFARNGRTFGDVKAYRVRIDGVGGAIVIPSRTIHPPKIAEVIAPVNLRERLGLKDGDRVRLEVVRE
ncbi:CTP-dependent riboflavin kinase [Thermococcus sp.]|uniref:CTP-dependent riboflavin kinase n=1 Tax=Thermococcus sp. TaxID=35749 RepID=UPI002622C435|nr:CTP-dependent riboflavin kinase [Thermococcus sp.]